MALIRIDWNPDAKKLRQFGWGLIGFGLLLAGLAWGKGNHAAARVLAPAGAVLGFLTLAAPVLFGRRLYKAWMGVSFVIGTAVSTGIMAFIYFCVLTPMALAMRLKGRDALNLKRTPGDSYWKPLPAPRDKTDFERLF